MNAPLLLPRPLSLSRRDFLMATTSLGLSTMAHAATKPGLLPHEIGITTASFQPQMRSTDPKERVVLSEIPRLVKGEVGLRIIDLNTTTLGSYEPAHVLRFRREVESAGCLVTNLKINIQASLVDPDPAKRAQALIEFKHWIRAAAELGARWVRPLPSKERPGGDLLVDSFRQLCDFAEPLGLRVLAENYRWIETDPQAIPELIKRLNSRVSAQPDTLNWADHPTRVAGLAAMFPLAVSCDFKLKELTASGEHPAFNLKECFNLGIAAGFRGPWCIEHISATRASLLRDLRTIKAMLSGWIAGANRR